MVRQQIRGDDVKINVRMAKMKQITGYGEDALTLCVLKNRLKEMCSKLKVEESSVLEILYRPSFGRGGRSKKNFGEFDAIIVADKIYLIESKWEKSSEVKKKRNKENIKIRPEQQNRFRAFRYYYRNWKRIKASVDNADKGANGSLNEDFNKQLISGMKLIDDNNDDSVIYCLMDYIVRTYPGKEIKDIILLLYSGLDSAHKKMSYPEYEACWEKLIIGSCNVIMQKYDKPDTAERPLGSIILQQAE